MDTTYPWLMLGDCLERMKEIPDCSVDMILCDLPYGTTACKWDVVIPFEPLWEQYWRILKKQGAAVLFGCEPFSSYLRLSALKNFKYDWIWDKVKPTGMFNSSHQPLRKHEIISVFCRCKTPYFPQKSDNPKGVEKRGLYNYNRYREGGEIVSGGSIRGAASSSYEPDKLLPTTLISFSKEAKPLHPTQKPVALLEYLVKTYTNEGEIVLDNTMGSGSTGVACVKTNRKFIGIERDEKYFQTSQTRIQAAIEEKSQLLFSDVS